MTTPPKIAPESPEPVLSNPSAQRMAKTRQRGCNALHRPEFSELPNSKQPF
jgi:hypothetical protein